MRGPRLAPGGRAPAHRASRWQGGCGQEGLRAAPGGCGREKPPLEFSRVFPPPQRTLVKRIGPSTSPGLAGPRPCPLGLTQGTVSAGGPTAAPRTPRTSLEERAGPPSPGVAAPSPRTSSSWGSSGDRAGRARPWRCWARRSVAGTRPPLSRARPGSCGSPLLNQRWQMRCLRVTGFFRGALGAAGNRPARRGGSRVPGGRRCLPAPGSALGASHSTVPQQGRCRAALHPPLALFNLPPAAPRGAFSLLPVSPCLSPPLPPRPWDQAGQLLPSAAVKGEPGSTPPAPWAVRGARPACPGTTVPAAASWPG